MGENVIPSFGGKWLGYEWHATDAISLWETIFKSALEEARFDSKSKPVIEARQRLLDEKMRFYPYFGDNYDGVGITRLADEIRNNFWSFDVIRSALGQQIKQMTDELVKNGKDAKILQEQALNLFCGTDTPEALFVKKFLDVKCSLLWVEEKGTPHLPKKAKAAPAEQAREPAADRQFIGWRGTPEQLKQLADELQKKKFVAKAEAFAGQFDKAARKAEGPCEWSGDVTLLAYLFEILKEASLVKKKSTPDRVIESSFFGCELVDGKPKAFKNLRQARTNYKANNTTLSGELNIDKEGIPDKGNIVHQIVMQVAGKG